MGLEHRAIGSALSRVWVVIYHYFHSGNGLSSGLSVASSLRTKAMLWTDAGLQRLAVMLHHPSSMACMGMLDKKTSGGR
jgi:hypothetical protein